MKRTWKKIKSKIIYQNPWIKLYEDEVIRPDGKKGIYGYLFKYPGTFIIVLDNDSIYLLSEYRYPLKKVIFNLPAGVVDKKDPLRGAKRELFEETGIIARKWKRLGSFYVGPGHETTQITIFLATDIDKEKSKNSLQDKTEAINKIIKVKIPKLKQMIIKGKIECGITLAALNLFFLYAKK